MLLWERSKHSISLGRDTTLCEMSYYSSYILSYCSRRIAWFIPSGCDFSEAVGAAVGGLGGSRGVGPRRGARGVPERHRHPVGAARGGVGEAERGDGAARLFVFNERFVGDRP